MKKNDILGRKNDVVPMEPLLVDVKEVARLFNVCERTVRTLTKNGELPVVKLTSRVLYNVEDLVEFVRQKSRREVGGSSEPVDFTSDRDLGQSLESGVIESVIVSNDPENEQLSAVVSAWSSLPSNIREAIMLLVRQHVQ